MKLNNILSNMPSGRYARGLAQGPWIGLAALLVAGCATPAIQPPPSDLRAKMQQVALNVSSASDELGRSDATPAAGAGEGASYGAKTGAGGAVGGGLLVGGAFGCNPGWNAFIIITCPAGLLGGLAAGVVAAVPAAAVGAAVGAEKAQTEDKAASAVAVYDEIIAKNDPVEKVQAQLTQEIEGIIGAEILDRGAIGSEPLTTLDIDIDVALDLSGRLDPDLVIEAQAHAGIRVEPETAWVYERTWHYRGELGKFYRLTDGQGTGLQNELDEVYRRMAHAIATDLYLTSSDTPKAAPRSAEGIVLTVDGTLATGEPGFEPASAEPMPQEPTGEDVNAQDPAPVEQIFHDRNCPSQRSPRSLDRQLDCETL